MARKLSDEYSSVERNLSRGLPVVVTIALDADTTRDFNRIERLLESVKNWNPYGFYIVCEHPNDDYLVPNPDWISNILDLIAGLRLLGCKVNRGLL